MTSAKRWRWLVLAAVVATVLVPSTGGFTSVQLDRDISIAVADSSEDAAIGIQTEQVELGVGIHDDVALATVRNNLDEPVDVTASVEGNGTAPQLSNVTDPALGVGETDTVTAEVDCSTAGNEVVTLAFTAEGDGNEVSLTRRVSVSCERNETAK